MVAAEKDQISFTVMYATHNAFRRDLDRFAAAVDAGRAGSPEVAAGWDNFKHQLHVHHTVEDAELWPRVEAAVAERPADLELMAEMEAEHAVLNPLMEQVDSALATQAPDLADRVGKLSTALGDHMAHEEKSALPLIQEVLTVKDWAAFRTGMARAQGPRGAATYIPWIMDGVGDEGRRAFLAEMPPPVKVINRVFLQSRYQKRHYWGS